MRATDRASRVVAEISAFEWGTGDHADPADIAERGSGDAFGFDDTGGATSDDQRGHEVRRVSVLVPDGALSGRVQHVELPESQRRAPPHSGGPPIDGTAVGDEIEAWRLMSPGPDGPDADDPRDAGPGAVASIGPWGGGVSPSFGGAGESEDAIDVAVTPSSGSLADLAGTETPGPRSAGDTKGAVIRPSTGGGASLATRDLPDSKGPPVHPAMSTTPPSLAGGGTTGTARDADIDVDPGSGTGPVSGGRGGYDSTSRSGVDVPQATRRAALQADFAIPGGARPSASKHLATTDRGIKVPLAAHQQGGLSKRPDGSNLLDDSAAKARLALDTGSVARGGGGGGLVGSAVAAEIAAQQAMAKAADAEARAKAARDAAGGDPTDPTAARATAEAASAAVAAEIARAESERRRVGMSAADLARWDHDTGREVRRLAKRADAHARRDRRQAAYDTRRTRRHLTGEEGGRRVARRLAQGVTQQRVDDRAGRLAGGLAQRGLDRQQARDERRDDRNRRLADDAQRRSLSPEEYAKWRRADAAGAAALAANSASLATLSNAYGYPGKSGPTSLANGADVAQRAADQAAAASSTGNASGYRKARDEARDATAKVAAGTHAVARATRDAARQCAHALKQNGSRGDRKAVSDAKAAVKAASDAAEAASKAAKAADKAARRGSAAAAAKAAARAAAAAETAAKAARTAAKATAAALSSGDEKKDPDRKPEDPAPGGGAGPATPVWPPTPAPEDCQGLVPCAHNPVCRPWEKCFFCWWEKVESAGAGKSKSPPDSQPPSAPIDDHPTWAATPEWPPQPKEGGPRVGRPGPFVPAKPGVCLPRAKAHLEKLAEELNTWLQSGESVARADNVADVLCAKIGGFQHALRRLEDEVSCLDAPLRSAAEALLSVARAIVSALSDACTSGAMTVSFVNTLIFMTLKAFRVVIASVGLIVLAAQGLQADIVDHFYDALADALIDVLPASQRASIEKWRDRAKSMLASNHAIIVEAFEWIGAVFGAVSALIQKGIQDSPVYRFLRWLYGELGDKQQLAILDATSEVAADLLVIKLFGSLRAKLAEAKVALERVLADARLRLERALADAEQGLKRARGIGDAPEKGAATPDGTVPTTPDGTTSAPTPKVPDPPPPPPPPPPPRPPTTPEAVEPTGPPGPAGGGPPPGSTPPKGPVTPETPTGAKPADPSRGEGGGTRSGTPPTPQTIKVSPGRRIHILDGDATGGGHGAGRNIAGKSEFPGWATDDAVIANAERIANNPASYADGRLPTPGPDRFTASGTMVGPNGETVRMTVIVERDAQNVVTTWPEGVPRNPRR